MKDRISFSGSSESPESRKLRASEEKHCFGWKRASISGGVSVLFVGDWLGWCRASIEDWWGGRVSKEKLHNKNMGLLSEYGVSVLPGMSIFPESC